MTKNMNSAPAIPIVITVLFLCGFNVHAQNIYNLKVPTGICKLVQDTPCFNDAARQKTFVVGKEVTSLSNLYEFCTSKEVVKSGKPARIILALDNSGSMCFEVTQCYGASNNDPTNKRVDGADAFVDSVASRCPNCQIGVIVYTGVAADTTGRGTVTQTQQPLLVGDPANVAILHNVIDQARCRDRLFKTQEVTKLAKRTLTFTGMVLDSAIKMVDQGYDTISSTMQRHVILLTDGDWQKPTTSTIINTYNANYPDRQLPIIHGVFISDTLTHVAQGFPPQGLVNCDSVRGIFDTMDLSFLQLAAQSSHGMYFPGSTPQTIVATFDTLFKVIVDTAKIGLASVTFASQNTGEQQQANIAIDPAFPDSTHYRVQVPSFQLEYGLNTFIITYVTQDPNLGRVTQTDTFTINRQTTSGTGEIEVFKTECTVDTVDMMIKCRPPNLLTAQFDTVTAKVDPNDVSKFVPNNIVVRAFTPFPDETDNRVLALFHLNDNSLINSAPGGQAGTGSNSLVITSAGAFGSAVRAGSFQTSIAMPISDDFTIECWITDSTGQSTDIIKGSNFSLGIANGYLTSAIGNTTITTTHAIDKNVWMHVAVARVQGSTNLYINGIPMAVAANSTESISGLLTIGNFAGGIIDEVRISSFVRTQSLQGKTLVQIPAAQNLQWKIKETTPTSPTAILPPDMWNGGELQFQFTDLFPEPVIINFFDTLASPPIMWSKNGEPVLFGPTGVIVTATLKDTSHEGHLDMIDLTWTDDIELKKVLPNANELIGSMIITALDGKPDTLHALTIVPEPAKKTIHIILNQNTGQPYETDWKDAKIVLTDVQMTIEGKIFVVGKYVDGADPIPIYVCYAPSNMADTLKITFSEPLEGDSLNLANFLRIQGDRKDPLSNPNLDAKVYEKRNDTWVIFFPYSTSMAEHAIYAYDWRIQEIFASGPPSPMLRIEYCYATSLVDKFRIGPNPAVFDGSMTAHRTIQLPTESSSKKQTGQIFELVLKRRVLNDNNQQEVQAWVTVFDAVGHVLVDQAQMGMDINDTSNAKLVYVWNGKNLRGMQAAGGTYLARYVVKAIIDGEIKREERGSGKLGIKTFK